MESLEHGLDWLAEILDCIFVFLQLGWEREGYPLPMFTTGHL